MNLQTTILIIGGGPSGLTASLLLSRYSIPHILIEKRQGPLAAPAAHAINRRTMEIFRQCGLPMDDIYGLDRHGDNPLSVRWAADLASPALAELNVTDLAEASAGLSRERLANISQYLLEALLLEHAQRQDSAKLLFGHEWLGFADDSMTVSDVRDADGNTIQIESTYVLAADGAGSPVRSTLEIGQSGPKNIATFLALSVRAPAPEGILLNWCLDPKYSGVTVTHNPDLTVYMRQLHEPWETAADFDDSTCKKLLADLFEGQEPELLRRDVWRMTAQVAERFRSGPVFLIGDAAHRFPPTGGLGLNSGVADAHNLVWKIAAQLNGAAEDLLDTYELERKPVVQKNCNESLKNFQKMDEVIRAIGLAPEKASLPAKTLSTLPLRVLPRPIRDGLFKLMTWPVRRRLNRCAADEETKRDIQLAADNQRAHFDMPHLELGYVYDPGFAIADAKPAACEVVPGARLPHITIDADNGRSTHDLLSCVSYTLISAGTPDCQHIETFGLPLQRIDIKTINNTDTPLDKALELKQGDWILVRPDGHIAARTST